MIGFRVRQRRKREGQAHREGGKKNEKIKKNNEKNYTYIIIIMTRDSHVRMAYQSAHLNRN